MNLNWVKGQFADARVKIAVGNTVIKLLEFWDKEVGLTESDAKEAMRIFSKLAFNHALVETSKDEVWIKAQRGQVSVGDIVRVSFDAFEGELGTIHNGRLGTIVAIRSGDVIFNSNDLKEPVIDGGHYKPEKLEKRIK